MRLIAALAFGFTLYGLLYTVSSSIGGRWAKTKSQNELHNLAATEDRIGPMLTGAKMLRDIVRNPRRHRLLGIFWLAVATFLWLVLIAIELSTS
jgi:hypothetical protein